MNDHPHVNPIPISILDRPKGVAQMPHWPGARKALGLALYGARQAQPLAMGVDFPDGSSMCVEVCHALPRELRGNAGMADKLGKPPYLAVLVLDRGAGIRVVAGIPRRVAPNATEAALREIAELLGQPAAVVGSGMDERNTRRSYFWGGV